MIHGICIFAYFCPPKKNTSLPPSICTTEVSAIPYNAAASACEKAAEWENALHVVMEVQKMFKIGTIITYGSGISACEKSLEWQRSLQLLKELPEKSLEGILGINTKNRFPPNGLETLGYLLIFVLKYGRLRLIWADLFMIFLSSLRTPNVGLCCAVPGENI